MGSKIGGHVFDDPRVDPVVGGGIPYGQSVSDDIHEIKMESRRSGELGPATAESWYKDAAVVGTAGWEKSALTVETLL